MSLVSGNPGPDRCKFSVRLVEGPDGVSLSAAPNDGLVSVKKYVCSYARSPRSAPFIVYRGTQNSEDSIYFYSRSRYVFLHHFRRDAWSQKVFYQFFKGLDYSNKFM